MYKINAWREKMQKQIDTLLNDIVADFIKWTKQCSKTDVLSDRDLQRVMDFDSELGYTVGSKYIKITNRNGGSVWGFVVATDKDKKFNKGDILKPAGFNAPARNAPRGNILDGGYTVAWTGPRYLTGRA